MIRFKWLAISLVFSLAFVLGCGAAEVATPQAPATPRPAQPPAPAAPVPTQAPQLPAQPAPAAPAPTAMPAPTVVAVVATPTRVVFHQVTATPETAGQPRRGGTLRTVSQASIKALDRIWTTAFVTHVSTMHMHESLLGWDNTDTIQPVMLKEWKVSPDSKTYTFTLRDGLAFHDGTPVTASDVVASINRWKQKSSSAVLMFKRVEGVEAVDATNLNLKLKEPYGLVIETLGNPVANYLPVIPEKLAVTSPDEQIMDYTGSGPYKFSSWQPGNRLVLERFDGYKPRSEPSSFLAGARNTYLDKIEYLEIPDAATKMAGLATGQWDFVDGAPQDFYPRLSKDDRINILLHKPGHEPIIAFNTTLPPFNNVKARQAVQAAVDAGAIMATYGAPELWQTCPAIFYCGGIWETDVGKENYNQKDIEKGKRLLQEAGYSGEPVTLMGPTDYSTIYPIAQIGKIGMEAIGLNVDFPAMDWATLVSRRAKREGWNALTTWGAYWAGFDPAQSSILIGKWFGWYESPRMQELVEKFTLALTPAEKKAIVEQIQLLIYEEVPWVHIGQFYSFDAARKWLRGYQGRHFPVYWSSWLERQ